MKRLAMFTGLLIWSNLLEADVISPAVVSLDISLDRYDSIKVDWYVPMILMVAILGIVSIYVLRWMRKHEESEKLSEADMKQKGE